MPEVLTGYKGSLDGAAAGGTDVIECTAVWECATACIPRETDLGSRALSWRG
jgi:hypothetical protein